MKGNFHVRFLGGCGRATACTYPTLKTCESGVGPIPFLFRGHHRDFG